MYILQKGAQEFGINISDQQLSAFKLYSSELAIWNKTTNLTAIRDKYDVETKHFLDSISIVPIISELIASGKTISVIDIGRGAGFPGLPLKILHTQILHWKIEKTMKTSKNRKIKRKMKKKHKRLKNRN